MDLAVIFDPVTLFGLLTISLMLVFYTLEAKSHWCVLGFALACGLASIYGFLSGAWPFGLVEAIWAVVACKRWDGRRRSEAVVSKY